MKEMRASGRGSSTSRGKLRKARPGLFGAQEGFTLIELLATMMVMGVLLGIAAVSISQVSAGMKLAGAKKQVEEAINRAKTAARQENVSYLICFYSSTAEHPDTYEFYCNTQEQSGESTTWSMEPVDRSVTGERVTAVDVEGKRHYYVEVSNNVHVEETVCLLIKPIGVDFRVYRVAPGTVTPVEGAMEVRLRAGGAAAAVRVSESGVTEVE